MYMYMNADNTFKAEFINITTTADLPKLSSMLNTLSELTGATIDILLRTSCGREFLSPKVWLMLASM